MIELLPVGSWPKWVMAEMTLCGSEISARMRRREAWTDKMEAQREGRSGRRGVEGGGIGRDEEVKLNVEFF
ncbi:hypothetical protein Leryth_004975 [Lithospermum erythrorhizon]|nr:hypothetical protein Leryth_004975 [Lithospermum erythrorhizon]